MGDERSRLDTILHPALCLCCYRLVLLCVLVLNSFKQDKEAMSSMRRMREGNAYRETQTRCRHAEKCKAYFEVNCRLRSQLRARECY